MSGFQQITLNKIKLSSHMTVEPEFLQDAELNIDPIVYMGGMLVAKLNADVIGENTDRFIAHYPSTAWQFFKQDYMPKWFVRKYPVKRTNIIANVTTAINQRVAVESGMPTVTFTNYINDMSAAVSPS